MKSLVVLEELHVGTTALKAIWETSQYSNLASIAISLTLKLDFILNNQGFTLVVDGLGEFGGDGMMGGLVLDDKSLVPLHALQDGGFLNSPIANVRPLLFGGLIILLGMRCLPPLLPIICELLEERCLEVRGLERSGQEPRSQQRRDDGTMQSLQ